MNIIPIAILLLGFETSVLLEARQLTLRENYVGSDKLLMMVRSPKDIGLYHYLRMLNKFHLNKKVETIESAKFLIDAFSVPDRYRSLAVVILKDAESWKSDDIADISRDVRNAQKRIANRDAGKETQAIQSNIIAKLDKLIKDAEQQQQKSQGSDGSPKNNPSSQPLPDSKPGGMAGKGNISNKKLEKTVQLWGSLPPKERIKAIEQIRKEYPAHYRDAIEEYLKRINREKFD